MKRNSFFPSLGLLVILNIIVKPVWIFAIDREVQNEVGTAEYGVYFSLLGLSIFLNFLLDWGLTVYFNRQLATDPEHFQQNTGSFLIVKLLFAIVYTAIVLGAALVAGIQRWDILILVVVIQVLTSFFVFLRNILTAKQWFRVDAWFSVLDKALMIVLCAGFIYYSSFFGTITLPVFLYIQAGCTFISILVIVAILLRRKVSFSWKKPYPGKSVLRASLPYALVILLMSAHYRLDGFLLERLHENGAHEAGLYAAGYRLLDAFNMVGVLISSFLLPFLANRLSRRKRIDEIVLNSRHLLMVFAVYVAVTTIFQAGWLYGILYDINDVSGPMILQWCIPVIIFHCLVHVYGTVLTARGLLVPFSYFLISSLTINIILNLVLIPDLGARACCISALISQAVCGIAVLIYASRKSGIDLHVRSILIYIFIALVLAAIYYWTRNTSINKWLLISVLGILTLTISIHFKLFDISIWKHKIINEEEKDA